jgi:hypothetical protein
MLHGLAIWFGLTNASGRAYLFWSGIAGDIGMLGGVTVLWRRLACHVDGCHRPGVHHVRGTPHVTCRKHHPTSGNTLESIHEAHAQASQTDR